MRLGKVAKDFNVGVQILIEILEKSTGITVEGGPNYNISEEQYSLLENVIKHKKDKRFQKEKYKSSIKQKQSQINETASNSSAQPSHKAVRPCVSVQSVQSLQQRQNTVQTTAKFPELKNEHIDPAFFVGKRVYVIDTNAFVQYPNILDKIDLEHNCLILCVKVVEELNRHKDNKNKPLDTQIKAQEAIKNILKYTKSANIIKYLHEKDLLPEDLVMSDDFKNYDLYILSAMIKYKDYDPILITGDKGFELIAFTLSLKYIDVEEFKNCR